MTSAGRTRRYAHGSHETFAVMVLLFFVSALCPAMSAGAADQRVEADCEISKGACTKTIGSLQVTLDIAPKPVSAMKENSFTVRIRPDQHPVPERITIDLGMPGMFMGNNVVTLRRQASGFYSGTGIIPRCPSGRRLWKATVNVPEGGKVEYLFDVAR